MGNGTIRDNRNGLIWLKNAGIYSTHTWDEANTIVSDLAADNNDELTDDSEAGDWRLPTIAEWEAFVVKDKSYSPAMCNAAGTGPWTSGDAFIDIITSHFWSSTGSGDNAYVMFMTKGVTHSTSKVNNDRFIRVWPVRDSF